MLIFLTREYKHIMVKFIGRISRKGVNDLYGSARAGIVIYQPAENHYEAQPVKMFEYMAAGLPVIASNFPLWKKIIEETGCGICVDPKDPKAVRKACLDLINNPQKGEEMGRQGRQAVILKYSWDSEEKKLLDLYSELEH